MDLPASSQDQPQECAAQSFDPDFDGLFDDFESLRVEESQLVGLDAATSAIAVSDDEGPQEARSVLASCTHVWTCSPTHQRVGPACRCPSRRL